MLLGPTNVNALTTLNNKRDVSDSYSKSQMDTALYDKQATIALKSPLFWTLNPSVPYEMSADIYTISQADSALALKAPLASPTVTGTVSGITKVMVGLGNVDNTSVANKPVSLQHHLL